MNTNIEEMEHVVFSGEKMIYLFFHQPNIIEQILKNRLCNSSTQSQNMKTI